MDFTAVEKNLTERGFAVQTFETKEEAARYLNDSIDGKTVGFGGSTTLEQLGAYDSLSSHNTVYSHWHGTPAGQDAASAQIYVLSANGVAETGEIINIDGVGNRVSASLFGHEKVVFVVGKNKIARDYDTAVWRARNVAAPPNAKRLNKKTPCAVKADKCYDCKSAERICRALVVLWQPMMGMETEVILVNEDLGY